MNEETFDLQSLLRIASCSNCPLNVSWRTQEPRDGDHQSAFLGSGIDIFDYRDLQSGDPVRLINWKLTAKRPDRPKVTQFEENRAIVVTLVVDLNDSMLEGTQRFTKNELAATVIAGMLQAATRATDSVRYLPFDRHGCQAAGRVRHANLVLGSLVQHVLTGQTGNKPTLESLDYSPEVCKGLLPALSRLPSKRSLVLVVSDQTGLSPLVRESLRKASAVHEIVWLHMQDLRERELPRLKLCRWLPLPASIILRDPDGRQLEIVTSDSSCRLWADGFRRREQALHDCLAEVGIGCQAFSTEESDESLQRKLLMLIKNHHRKRLRNGMTVAATTTNE